jgi:hypothetical protein
MGFLQLKGWGRAPAGMASSLTKSTIFCLLSLQSVSVPMAPVYPDARFGAFLVRWVQCAHFFGALACLGKCGLLLSL